MEECFCPYCEKDIFSDLMSMYYQDQFFYKINFECPYCFKSFDIDTSISVAFYPIYSQEQ